MVCYQESRHRCSGLVIASRKSTSGSSFRTPATQHSVALLGKKGRTPSDNSVRLRVEAGLQAATIVPREAEATGYGFAAKQAHSAKHRADKDWRSSVAGPELRDGARDALVIGMEDTVVPGACAFGEIGIVADDVKRRLEDAVLQRQRVRGHEVDVADAVAADFIDEVVEVGGVGEVGDGVGLDAMAIASTDEQLIPLLREQLGLAIFLPTAEAVQLECMDEVIAGREELVDAGEMKICTDLVEAPDGVVEDDENLGVGVEFGKDFVDARDRRRRGEPRQGAHPLLCCVGGKVVDADVEFGVTIGHGPLDGDRDLNGRAAGAEL